MVGVRTTGSFGLVRIFDAICVGFEWLVYCEALLEMMSRRLEDVCQRDAVWGVTEPEVARDNYWMHISRPRKSKSEFVTISSLGTLLTLEVWSRERLIRMRWHCTKQVIKIKILSTFIINLSRNCIQLSPQVKTRTTLSWVEISYIIHNGRMVV